MRDKVKILVVEDEIPVAMMMVHILTRAGCDVQAAHTGRKGMELAADSRFNLIALDIDLPDVNGFLICSELKQRHITRHTPIIFISGRSKEEDLQRSLEVGASDYITKPFEVDDFIFRIISLARAKSSQSNFPDEHPDTDSQSFCNTAQGNQ